MSKGENLLVTRNNSESDHNILGMQHVSDLTDLPAVLHIVCTNKRFAVPAKEFGIERVFMLLKRAYLSGPVGRVSTSCVKFNEQLPSWIASEIRIFALCDAQLH